MKFKLNWYRWTLYPVLLAFLFWAFLTSFVQPRLEDWVKNNIERVSANNTPFVISLDDFQIDFSSASLVVEGLHLKPKDGLEKFLRPIEIGTVAVNIDTFQLLTQRLQVRAIFVNDLKVELDVDPLLETPSQPEKFPVQKILETINSIPIQRVYLVNPNIRVLSKKQKWDIGITGQVISAHQDKNLVTLKGDVPKIQASLDTDKLNTKNLTAALKLTAQLNPKELTLVHSEISTAGIVLRAKGELQQVENLFLGSPMHFSLQGKVNLADLYNEWKNRLKQKVPNLGGNIEAQVIGDWTKQGGLKAGVDLKTDQVKVSDFELGQAQMTAQVESDRLFLDELQIHHAAGQAILKQSSLQLSKPYQFNGTLNVGNLNLQELFNALQLKDIPVQIEAQGQLPCSGTLDPIIATCYGDIKGNNIWVGSSLANKNSTIVAIDEMKAKGKVKVTVDGVEIDSQLNLADNWGHASGSVEFKKGFNFKFDTKELNLANVTNLINLKWRGAAAISGSTAGDSHAATLDMHAITKDFALENYYLDQLDTKINYKKGVLSLTDASVNVENLRAEGALGINFAHEPDTRIEGEFNIPQLSLGGIHDIVENIIPLPKRMQGKGSGHVKFEGPLNFWKMNMNINAEANEVAIGPESFGHLQAQVNSNDGNIDLTNVNFTRNNSKIFVRGKISNKQIFDLQLVGQQWRLEETELLSKVGLNLLGSLNFTGEVTGPVSKPLLQSRGNVSETVLNDQEVPNSFFTLQADKEHVQINSNVFGNKIQSDIDIPMHEKRPFHIRMKTLEWNFAQLLAILSGNLQPSEFDSRLSMEMNVKSESGSLSDIDGSLRATTFMLKRSQTSLQNTQPISIEANNGTISIKSFNLEGPQKSELRVSGDNFRFENLGLRIQSDFDIRILHIFFPFLDDLGGRFALSAQVRGSYLHPQIVGSSSLDQAFFKLRNFPHPFENVSSQVTFSQSSILIRDLKGSLAGGELTGEGQIQIVGPRNLPANLRFHLENPQLTVPEKIRTTGTADLTLTGSWFPFVLGGDYVIRNGLFEKELGSNASIIMSPKQNQFLPKVIKEARFEPLLMNVNVDFQNSIQVKNSLIDGIAAGTLRVIGPPQNPSLLGKVEARKGSKIIFKDKVFEVQNGLINFNNNDEINPDLYIVATARVNEYDVTLLVQGPAKTANFHLSSVPPLPDNEIVSLLALGLTSSQIEHSISADTQSKQTANEVFGAVVSQTFGKGFQDALGVQLQVTSSFDTAKNISVPKLTASKKLNARTSVQVSHPLSGSQTNELKLQYQINRAVSVIGSVENRSASEDTATNQNSERELNIFGLDLEFRREFK